MPAVKRDTALAAAIGREIQRVRKAQGIGVCQFAALAGVSHVMVLHWESGKKMPSLTSFVRVAAVLGVSLDELAGLRR